MGGIRPDPMAKFRTGPPPPTWTVANGVGIALTGMTLVSYIPQYHRLLALRSSAGISVTSVLLSTLMAQNQVANMYYLYKLRPYMHYGIPIASPPALRDWINLSQIMAQWLCSLPLLALVITTPGGGPTDSTRRELISKKGAAVLWAANGLFYYLCTILVGPKVDTLTVIVHNIHSGVLNPIFTLLAGASFFFQAGATRAAGALGALSKLTLGLQAATFLVSAVSWPFRMVLADNVYLRAAEPVVLSTWYPLVGWTCVNSAVMAVGQGVMLYVASKVDGGGGIRLDGGV